MATVAWLRQDLRLADNPALLAAVERGGPVVPAYVWAPEEEGAWPPGAASRWWLHQSLQRLDEELRRRGSRLVIRRGPSLEALARLAKECGAGAVYWTRRYEPAAIARDARVKAELRRLGLSADSFKGSLLVEPWEVKTKQGKPFQVFTPFWKALLAGPAPEEPRPAPARLEAPGRWPKSVPLGELGLEPGIDWAAGLRATWTPGEAGAAERLERFLADAVRGYKEQRDRPDRTGTSELSPHLHLGEIGPRQVWHAVKGRLARDGVSPAVGEPYLRQLGWREFGCQLLFHLPHTAEKPLRAEFGAFPWRKNAQGLAAWQRGRTGYPLVDAGMRQLWATGWMHNRVRMVVASFLVKDLLVPWQDGARWFWDTLVDADLANNTLGWQWTAGCGADAAPYFRVFNPMGQGEKFDPSGAYVRRWVPELARLEDRWIQRPWEAPEGVLGEAGVVLGKTYPRPIVDHARAREEALEAYYRLGRAVPE